MSEASGHSVADGLWKSIALLMASFILCAVFLGLPVGAKITGEDAIRRELRRTQEDLALTRQDLKRERQERQKLEAELREPIRQIPLMANDLKWMRTWIQRAQEGE